MEDENVAQKFETMHQELRKLYKQYNPAGENLHFYPLESVDNQLYSHLLKLATEGLKIVNQHRDFFLHRSALYIDLCFPTIYIYPYRIHFLHHTSGQVENT